MVFKSLNDARHCYTYRSCVYAGKPKKTPSTFYVSGMENSIKVLVECLSECVDLDERSISMDRLYTSVSIANWLLTKNITCVGTLQTQRVGIPEEIRSTKDREE